MLGEAAAALALGRLDHGRVKAAGAHQLPWSLEAADVADLGEKVAGEDRPDSEERLQRPAALVAAGVARSQPTRAAPRARRSRRRSRRPARARAGRARALRPSDALRASAGDRASTASPRAQAAHAAAAPSRCAHRQAPSAAVSDRAAAEPLARGLEPALAELARVPIEHHRPKDSLVDIDACVQHLPGPPFVTEVGPRT